MQSGVPWKPSEPLAYFALAIESSSAAESNQGDSEGGICCPISKGKIEVTSWDGALRVRYELRFTRTFLGFSLLVLAFFGPLLATQSGWALIQACSLLGLGWVWIVGGNYALTAYRFEA